MRYKSLHLDIGTDNFDLEFDLIDNPITELWLERMDNRGTYPLDHPERFTGFNTQEQELDRFESKIKQLIDTINSHQVIIDKPFDGTQDYLNYIHTIFEQYHRGLDQQTHDYWINAPIRTRLALAELNVAIHQLETAQRMDKNNTPRIVCTWWGMPKTQQLPVAVKSRYGNLNPAWGSICLSYVEIGKTLEDLATDNDVLHADAFKPFDHYSADFVARFFNFTNDQVNANIKNMQEYFLKNQEFFRQQGYDFFNHVDLLPYRYPVANLAKHHDKDEIMNTIRSRQLVNKVYLE